MDERSAPNTKDFRCTRCHEEFTIAGTDRELDAFTAVADRSESVCTPCRDDLHTASLEIERLKTASASKGFRLGI